VEIGDTAGIVHFDLQGAVGVEIQEMAQAANRFKGGDAGDEVGRDGQRMAAAAAVGRDREPGRGCLAALEQLDDGDRGQPGEVARGDQERRRSGRQVVGSAEGLNALEDRGEHAALRGGIEGQDGRRREGLAPGAELRRRRPRRRPR
jgi:hypothetical protein